MKTTSKLHRQFLPLSLAVALGCLFPALHSANASVLTLNFAGGGSTASPVTNSVDAYTGQIGDGWLTAWTGSNNGNVTRSAQVLSANPLTSGKNYLQLTVEKTSAANNTASGTVTRKYDITSVPAEHVISFQFRLDSDPSQFSRIRFFDSTASQLSESSGASWFIRADSGGNWIVYNGRTSINTGMALIQNNIYDFSIHAFADNTYGVTIKNLTTPQTYTTNSLGFYTNTEIGGYLNFIVTPIVPEVGETATSVVSLGSISVVPEPNQAALLGMAALAFALWRFRRRSVR